MLEFNLEYYRAFYYVAKLANTTKAAEALFLTQSAVSRSIKKLEERLHTVLFIRTGKGMLLTPEGKKLFEHVAAAFERLMLGEQELEYLGQHSSGTIKIAATETPLYYFLLPKIESFKRVEPHVNFHVTGNSTKDTISMLRDGKTDLALAVSPIKDIQGIKITEGKAFRDIFVAGPNYSELKDRVLSAQEICNYPLITVERGTSARSLIDLWFEEQGVFFEPAFSVRTSTTVLPFVESNLGIGILPTLFTEKPISEKRIFEVKTNKPFYERTILIAYLDDTTLSPLCKRFLAHCL